jgi:lipoate-protein ligase A
MPGTIHLYPLATADGPTNMAADEVLLDVAADRGVASLRFYTWTEPTLSLGYFQPAAAVNSLGLGIPWVRRATGGAAIVHHHELTYALALPEGMAGPTGSWICRFHHLLREVLAESGIAAEVVACGGEKKLGEVLCFLHQTPGDLLIKGSKVAGSAQRKRRGALLQHGSLLLRRSEFAPMLPGINDAAGREVFVPAALAELLRQRLASATGWGIESAPYTSEMEQRREAIVAGRYATAEWNEKR